MISIIVCVLITIGVVYFIATAITDTPPIKELWDL